ncbi:MAG TPA: methyl-accepting chemotaxis protein [Spirochaetota bacterium]|nr:methyl-accepting chemotaxis protein [Spirochaetota bacterium]HPI89479.1 methyl-accepting chemotaxis protein [Spirochaetota bacterium]HPR49336.1 methyl-accepting chemotaxis protein [Spirochaetota bacterium]
MANIVSRVFLQKYEDKDYLTRKKAGLILFFAFAVMIALNLGALISLSISVERAKGFAQSAIPASIISIIVIILVKIGKSNIGAHIFVSLCTLVVIAGFFNKEPLVAYNTMVYFMFVVLVFAAAFSTKIIASILMGAFVLADIGYFLLHKSNPDPVVASIIKVGLVDSLAALFLAYFISLLSITMLQNSLNMINDEKKKNDTQMNEMKNLYGIIKESARKISSFAENLFSKTQNFSKNLQTQAISAGDINTKASSAADTIAGTASNIQEQYSSVMALVESINNLAMETDQLKQGSGDVRSAFSSVIDLARDGENAVANIDKNSRELIESTSRLSSIMVILEDLFDKIQLLALNAAIEAARAGDQGKGFAVVADEVNKLSEKSMTSLKEINQLISSNVKGAEDGSQNIDIIIRLIKQIFETINMLDSRSKDIFSHINNQEQIKDEIEVKIDDLKHRSVEIKDSTGEQKQMLNSIAEKISEINSLIQSNTSVAEELSLAAEELAQVAEGLNQRVTGND